MADDLNSTYEYPFPMPSEEEVAYSDGAIKGPGHLAPPLLTIGVDLHAGLQMQLQKYRHWHSWGDIRYVATTALTSECRHSMT